MDVRGGKLVVVFGCCLVIKHSGYGVCSTKSRNARLWPRRKRFHYQLVKKPQDEPTICSLAALPRRLGAPGHAIWLKPLIQNNNNNTPREALTISQH